MAFVWGTRYSYGVFFKSIEGAFDLTRGATSIIFSVYMLLCSIFGVLGGWALDRFGPRIVVFLMGLLTGLSLLLTSQANSAWQLLLTYSLLLALGTAGSFGVVSSTVSRWFHRKRGVALGIALSGGPFGAVVMAPFTSYLISHFGWRTTFVTLGLIAWITIASFSLLLRKDPSDIGLLPDGAEPEAADIGPGNKGDNANPTGLTLGQAFSTDNFWFLTLAYFLLSLNLHLIFTHTVPHAIDMGIPPMEAAVILSLIGVGGILGRLIIGRISDIMGRKVPAFACTLLQFGVLIWLIWARQLWMFYLFAVVFGFTWGGFGIIITALIGDIFGLHNIGKIMGTSLIGWNIGAAAGSTIGGVIFDVSGHYSTAFTMGAVNILIATLLVALIHRENSTGGN